MYFPLTKPYQYNCPEPIELDGNFYCGCDTPKECEGVAKGREDMKKYLRNLENTTDFKEVFKR
jgi:hypothetical protein